IEGVLLARAANEKPFPRLALTTLLASVDLASFLHRGLSVFQLRGGDSVILRRRFQFVSGSRATVEYLSQPRTHLAGGLAVLVRAIVADHGLLRGRFNLCVFPNYSGHVDASLDLSIDQFEGQASLDLA